MHYTGCPEKTATRILLFALPGHETTQVSLASKRGNVWCWCTCFKSLKHFVWLMWFCARKSDLALRWVFPRRMLIHYRILFLDKFVWKSIEFRIKHGQQYTLPNSTIKQTVDRFHTKHTVGYVVDSGKPQLITPRQKEEMRQTCRSKSLDLHL